MRNAAALLLLIAPLSLLLPLLPRALGAHPASGEVALGMGINLTLLADGLAVFMAIASSFLGVIIILYSYGYMAHADNQNEYYLMVVLFIGAMMGITLSQNLVFLYVFWEISAICCWRLIGFFREDDFVRRANKTFLITGAGALCMLAGFLIIYNQYGTMDLTALRGQPISSAATALILLGILSKSATLPLHSWIADAGVAPTPATALLHAAVLVKIGVYVYARLFCTTFVLEDVWQTAVPVIAAVSATLSAGAAIAENDIKRIIAYSTVSQIDFILLGLSVGGEMALSGAILYILMHAISKAGLFLCAGIVEHSLHTKDIRRLGGLIKTMPRTAAAFFLCALSVMGIPPFGGFFSKYMVIAGTIEAGQPVMAAVFILGAAFTIVYLLRAFIKVFLGKPHSAGAAESGGAADGVLAAEGDGWMLSCVILLAALSVVSGLLIYYPSSVVQTIVGQMGVR